MRIRIATIAAALLAGACATAPPPAPPPPGPDIYACTGDSGRPRYLRITPSAFHVFLDGAWGENQCAKPGQSCSSDSSGKITVVQFIQVERMPRIDTVFTYDLPAGLETHVMTIAGGSPRTSTYRCSLLQ
jgi:hypothetical protein